MATTTNYGWTTPDNTDLVKDGALAIRTLGSAIDTSMNTALGTKKAGMVLLNTTSFSAVASQSVSDVFSATYNYYQSFISITGSASATLSMRFRVSGADNSTANYNLQTFRASSTTVDGGRVTGQTSFTNIGGVTSALEMPSKIDIVNPFATAKTGILIYASNPDDLSRVTGAGGYFDAATSFTGFSLIVSSGTISGVIKTYGYN